MRISSSSFGHRERIPAEFAMGAADGFGGNRNPQLAWDDVPEGARSFVLFCIDPDAPTDASLAGKEGATIAVEHPRGEFVHWVMVDIASDVRGIAAGSCSNGVTAHGKATPPGPAGAQQGLNAYTQWFVGNTDMGGDYFGYDGPYPPPNDLRMHRYFFRVFALDVPTLDLSAKFTGGGQTVRIDSPYA